MERRNIFPLPCCCQILVSEKFLRRAGAGEEAENVFLLQGVMSLVRVCTYFREIINVS